MGVVRVDEVGNSRTARIEERLRLKCEYVLTGLQTLQQGSSGPSEEIRRPESVAPNACSAQAGGESELAGNGTQQRQDIDLADDMEIIEIDHIGLEIGKASLQVGEDVSIGM